MSTESTRPSSRKGRPNYTLEYKRQVAMAACEPNISVAKLALAHGLNPNMVFKWRRQYRAGLLSKTEGEKAVLVPVGVSADPVAYGAAKSPEAPPAETAAASSIEIELNGACVRVTGMVDPVQLRLVLRCLMPA